jgi:hypothetical protein
LRLSPTALLLPRYRKKPRFCPAQSRIEKSDCERSGRWNGWLRSVLTHPQLSEDQQTDNFGCAPPGRHSYIHYPRSQKRDLG